MPPDESRSEGTPSLSERAERWDKPFFAYFFEAFVKKVSRRKGETASGNPRRNGYSPETQEHGRPKGRQAQAQPQNPVKTLNTQAETSRPIETTQPLPHLTAIPNCAGAP